MKKIVFILVLLLFTAPAWAATTVIIDANQVVPGSNEVEITYEVVAPDVNLPRGFGLNITVTDGNIVDCIPYMEGECTADVGNRGFGIFPGSIVIDPAPPQGEIIDYGNPAALPGAIGTPLGSGIDTNCITIELGSLYQEPNAPPLSGVLCTIVITKSCWVRIEGNAARCGEGSEPLGVVMENPDEVPIITFGDCNAIVEEGPEDCFPSDNPAYDDWVAMGKPDCWCAPPYGSGYQCDGDVDGATETLLKYRIYGNDVAILAANWKKKIDDPTLDPCADIDHAYETLLKYRVYGNDVAIIAANWKKKDADLPGDCPRP